MSRSAVIPVSFDLRSEQDLRGLASQVSATVRETLHQHGAVLFHTGKLTTTDLFAQLLGEIGADLKIYEYGSTPRSLITGKVYTSTEYPSEQTIVLHNELAYTTSWPTRLWFYCEVAAEKGGRTPIADSRAIYRNIDARIRTRFEEQGLLYIRNYRRGLDLGWQKTFNTSNKADVETFCASAGIRYEWRAGDELKTWQKCQATARHPVTGEPVWFNQAHLFHVSNLDPQYEQVLRSLYKEDELPRNVLYGDGSPIENSVLNEVRAVIEAEKRLFDWTPGDVLVLDNLLFAHGREPYEGARRIAVAME